MINTLLFDLDNTLIDRNNAMELYLRDLLSKFHFSSEILEQEITTIMQKDDWGYLNRTEFCTWLLDRHRQISVHKKIKKINEYIFINKMFQSIPTYIRPDFETMALLSKLKKKYKLVLATNGGSETQRLKLARATLNKLFDKNDIYISSEMGFEKPDKAFFNSIIFSLKANPNEVIMIGDHPLNDIHGAALCGIKTCWISKGRQFPTSYSPPSIIIQHLNEIEAWTQHSI